ncbi:MAG TPA: bifunctional glutamate N-acetyltransferase/amino-acid acetyltransferase ArgJ [Acidimicrobiales bacterium]|nr:bifunctional glutamate N-acetyltransferase/amino-acid acetyltransferase ArgJ [Acidimicrobiales bacterium]
MSVVAARGFVAHGVASGIKASGHADLALVATADGRPVPAAGVFTSNLMTAAPVQVSQGHLASAGGRAAAVVLNSGNANAGTGGPGRADAERTCAAVAAELGCAEDEVLVCSTGLIGIPLPVEPLLAGVTDLVAGLTDDEEGGAAAADALLTTDTRRKEAVATAGAAVVGGMAKGAAMLAPAMATMLAVLTTDAEADGPTLRRVLAAGVEGSFNALLTDGCTSTNDTVLLLASGEAGPVDEADLAAAVASVCGSLAEQMADDAEGATKVVRLTVTGAASDAEARAGARQIARSVLCRCSWYGRDPYWGRLASELGSAGITFEQERVAVAYGGVTVAAGGVSVAHDAEAVAAHMDQRYLHIACDLGLGAGTATVLTNDLSHAYVDENMGTS